MEVYITSGVTYKQSGVDIENADATKAAMASSLTPRDPRVLNRHGAFASLFEAKFPGVVDPILVLKAEEPGSKQLLAFQHNRVRGICFDLINHLIDDIIVMGATPLAVLDTIICGQLDKKIVLELVGGISKACQDQECSLVGGETSEQPRVIDAGRYILAASILGVVDRSKIIDGSKIKNGDVVLALASSGLHTNGYSLVRSLIDSDPALINRKVGLGTFLDAIMEPHRCYYHDLKPFFGNPAVHGLAHITGGGIAGNLNRILPKSVSAKVDFAKLRIPEVFRVIEEVGSVSKTDMLQTYNLGVGITLVAEAASANEIAAKLSSAGCDTWPIGTIIDGDGSVLIG